MVTCQGRTRANTPCTNTAKVEHDGKQYCKIHFKTASAPPKAEEKKHRCSGYCNDGDRCTSNGKHKHDGKHYCGIHIRSARSPDEKDSKPKAEKKKVSPVDPCSSSDKYTSDEQRLVDLINQFLSMSMNDSDLKKQGRKILLKVHPDKCRMPNIDAHRLTQKVLARMQLKV